MNARSILSKLLESDDILTQQDLDEPPMQREAPAAKPPAEAPRRTGLRGRPERFIVGSMRGVNIDDAAGEGSVLVVLEQPRDTWPYKSLTQGNKIVGVYGYGKEGDYGAIGEEVEILVDNMGGGRFGRVSRRRLGDGYWKIIGYGPATKAFARSAKVRSIYHFD